MTQVKSREGMAWQLALRLLDYDLIGVEHFSRLVGHVIPAMRKAMIAAERRAQVESSRSDGPHTWFEVTRSLRVKKVQVESYTDKTVTLIVRLPCKDLVIRVRGRSTRTQSNYFPTRSEAQRFVRTKRLIRRQKRWEELRGKTSPLGAR